MSIKKWMAAVSLTCIILTSTISQAPGFLLAVSPTPPAAQALPGPDFQVIKTTVKKGDTPSSLLTPYLSLQDIYRLTRESAPVFPLEKIRTGRPCQFILNQKNLVGFEYEIDQEDRLVIEKQNDIFSIRRVPIEYDLRVETVSATIDSSLFEAIRQAGEEGALAFKLAHIFEWDIDFRDIRPKDQFRVMVEKKYRQGKFFGYGKVRAALFINRGRRFTAFLHNTPKGRPRYYDENGNSLEKAFLKAPLSFSRISSGFTKKRFHPILKEFRSHPGVDYAAPTGTPIRTVGDGIIVGMGYSKTMGNHVIIRHGRGYMTRYYHMSKFGKGMKKNRRVVQGEVIGFVGMTGLATGPHLCFRMKKNGKHVNPLTHEAPSADPVPAPGLADFQARAKALISQMYMARYSELKRSA